VKVGESEGERALGRLGVSVGVSGQTARHKDPRSSRLPRMFATWRQSFETLRSLAAPQAGALALSMTSQTPLAISSLARSRSSRNIGIHTDLTSPVPPSRERLIMRMVARAIAGATVVLFLSLLVPSPAAALCSGHKACTLQWRTSVSRDPLPSVAEVEAATAEARANDAPDVLHADDLGSDLAVELMTGSGSSTLLPPSSSISGGLFDWGHESRYVLVSVPLVGPLPEGRLVLVEAEVWGSSSSSPSGSPADTHVATVRGLRGASSEEGSSPSLDFTFHRAVLAQAGVDAATELRRLTVRDSRLLVVVATADVIPLDTGAGGGQGGSLSDLEALAQADAERLDLPGPATLLASGASRATYRAGVLAARAAGDEGAVGARRSAAAINCPPNPADVSLVLVHGWCGTPGVSIPEGDFDFAWSFGDTTVSGTGQSTEEFAQAIASATEECGIGGTKGFSVIGHSQGGLAALRLHAYLESGLTTLEDDLTAAGLTVHGPGSDTNRLIQSIGSPYRGTPLASFGQFACSDTADYQTLSAETRMTALMAISMMGVDGVDSSAFVHYYRTDTQHADGYALSILGIGTEEGVCSILQSGVIPGNDDGVVGYDEEADLSDWYSPPMQGNFVDDPDSHHECHNEIAGRAAQTHNFARNRTMNYLAARPVGQRPARPQIYDLNLKSFTLDRFDTDWVWPGAYGGTVAYRAQRVTPNAADQVRDFDYASVSVGGTLNPGRHLFRVACGETVIVRFCGSWNLSIYYAYCVGDSSDYTILQQEVSAPACDATAPSTAPIEVSVGPDCSCCCEPNVTDITDAKGRATFTLTPVELPDPSVVNVDACETSPCGANTTCVDKPPPAGSDTTGRTCACAEGFTGDAESGCTETPPPVTCNGDGTCDPSETCDCVDCIIQLPAGRRALQKGGKKTPPPEPTAEPTVAPTDAPTDAPTNAPTTYCIANDGVCSDSVLLCGGIDVDCGPCPEPPTEPPTEPTCAPSGSGVCVINGDGKAFSIDVGLECCNQRLKRGVSRCGRDGNCG